MSRWSRRHVERVAREVEDVACQPTLRGGRDGTDDDGKLPCRKERIVRRYKWPGVVPVEVGRCCRHSQEQQPDGEDKRILPPKAPVKLVLNLPIVLRREIHDGAIAAEPLLRRRLAGPDGLRPSVRGGLVIVANGA